MADNDYSVIKPVQSLTNVGKIGSSKDHQDNNKQNRPHSQSQSEDDFLEEKLCQSVEDAVDREVASEDPGEHIIDFRA